MQNKTKTVKIFKFSVLNYPYLAFVVLSKQQLTISFSVLRRCYQNNCVQKLLNKVKFTKCNFGNTGPKTSITVIMKNTILYFRLRKWGKSHACFYLWQNVEITCVSKVTFEVNSPISFKILDKYSSWLASEQPANTASRVMRKTSDFITVG